MADTKLQQQELTPAKLAGEYTFAQNKLTNKNNGLTFKVCQQFNRQNPHAPRLYIADEENYISGLFYDHKNAYNLSLKGYEQDKLQLTLTGGNTAVIKPLAGVELLQFKGRE